MEQLSCAMTAISTSHVSGNAFGITDAHLLFTEHPFLIATGSIAFPIFLNGTPGLQILMAACRDSLVVRISRSLSASILPIG